MAGRPKNRLELRRQYDAAEPLDPMEDESEDVVEETEDDEPKPKKKAKAPAKPKATKASKAAKPAARMRVMWVVVSDAFKTVATFEYTQKEAAEARAAELTAKGKGTHFVQKVKEPMPENAPGLGAAIPREELAPTKAKAAAATAAAVEDEEEEDEDEAEPESDGDDDEE